MAEKVCVAGPPGELLGTRSQSSVKGKCGTVDTKLAALSNVNGDRAGHGLSERWPDAPVKIGGYPKPCTPQRAAPPSPLSLNSRKALGTRQRLRLSQIQRPNRSVPFASNSLGRPSNSSMFLFVSFVKTPHGGLDLEPCCVCGTDLINWNFPL